MRTLTMNGFRASFALGLACALAAAAPLQSQQAPRVHGPGYSVPIPAGFHADSTSGDAMVSLWLRGGVALVPDTSVPSPALVWIAPRTAASPITNSKECRRAGVSWVAELDADLESARMTDTPTGQQCQLLVIERDSARARSATLLGSGTVAYWAQCVYESQRDSAPGWCREVIGGWRPEELGGGALRIPRWVPEQRAADDEQYEEVLIDEWPQVVSSPSPAYPPFLLHANIEGSVTLVGVVGLDGKIVPQSISVVESTHPGFEPAAAETLLGTVFRPGKVNGQPVRVLIQIPVVFRRQNKPK